MNKKTIVETTYTTIIISLCVILGITLGRMSKNKEIKECNRKIEHLKFVSVKSMAMITGYSLGIHDGFEAYTRTFRYRGTPTQWSRWVVRTDNIQTSILQLDQEKIAMEFLDKQGLSTPIASNYMLKCINHYKEIK